MKPLSTEALTPEQLALVISIADRIKPLVTPIKQLAKKEAGIYDAATIGLLAVFNPITLLALLVFGG
jgi:hypothetical protein